MRATGSCGSRGWSALAMLLGSAALTCTRAQAPSAAAAPSWEYVVDAPGDGLTVRVEGRFVSSGTPNLEIDEDAAPFVKELAVDDGRGWRAIEHAHGEAGADGGPDSAFEPDEWLAPECARECRVRYAIDLAALAHACASDDCALTTGTAVLSPASVWLMHPAPKGDAPVTLRFKDASRVLSGLREANGARVFRSPELDEGSFTAFGAIRRARVDVTGAALDVALLGSPVAMGDDAVRAWIADAARCDAALFGRFSVDRASIFIVPIPGENDVLFGRVLALAGPSVMILMGEGTTAATARADWVLVHELFHLGFPSTRGEHTRWLGEGLATYYEPLLRARCGLMTERDAWKSFALQMDRGALERGVGLDARSDLDAVYWGGALFLLASDVAIREETRGARSLDDWIRAVHAKGGDASHVWAMDDLLREGDRATGTHVLTSMHARLAVRGEPIDPRALLARLGVARSQNGNDDDVTIRDDAPLAAMRRAMTARAGTP